MFGFLFGPGLNTVSCGPSSESSLVDSLLICSKSGGGTANLDSQTSQPVLIKHKVE